MTADFTIGTKKLRVCFDIGQEYPFSPMNVSLQPLIGEISIENIGNALIRNVKPGYGYLARASDCIASYMNSLA